MFKKRYGILKTETIIHYPVKKYGEMTEKEIESRGVSLVCNCDSQKDRDKKFKEIFTKGYWDEWKHKSKNGSEPLPTEKPPLPKDMKEFDGWWNDGIFWRDPEIDAVYKDVHCIYDRDIYGGQSNKINRRKTPYRREIYTYMKVEFMQYEEDDAE